MPIALPRHLHVFQGHITDVLGKVPLMAFGVFRAVAAVAVKLVLRGSENRCASPLRLLEMLIHVVDVDVGMLGRLPELFGVAVAGAGKTHHDDAVA